MIMTPQLVTVTAAWKRSNLYCVYQRVLRFIENKYTIFNYKFSQSEAKLLRNKNYAEQIVACLINSKFYISEIIESRRISLFKLSSFEIKLSGRQCKGQK